MKEELKEIVADVMDVSAAEIDDNSGPETIDSWDSLNLLRVITAVEEELDIQMSMDDIESISSFGVLYAILENYRNMEAN